MKFNLYSFLFTPVNKEKDTRTIFWFCLSMVFITICLIIHSRKFLLGEYTGEIYEDDTRVYAFWLQRFSYPGILPKDLMSEYFESVTPPGYTALFYILSLLSIKPIYVSHLLPLILTILAAVYIFYLSIEILPIPTLGFLSTLLFWIMSGPVTDSPRGFVYVFVPAFAYYILRNLWVPCLLVIFLQGFFYSPFVFILIGIVLIRLIYWRNNKFYFSTNRKDYLFASFCLIVAFLSLIPYLILSLKFAPSITASEARLMPEWLASGRSPYFYNKPVDTFLFGWQSGLRPHNYLVRPMWVLKIGLLLPLVICLPKHFPLVLRLKQHASILLQITVVSLLLFISAHFLFLKLFLPNRYTAHTFSMVLVLASTITTFIILDGLLSWIRKKGKSYSFWKNIIVVITIALLSYLSLFSIYLKPKIGSPLVHVQEVENFLTQQPKDIVVASLETKISDNIPMFAKRSVLISWEYGLPYHLKYYNQIKDRAINLIDAHYTDDLSKLQSFIKNYNVNFFVIRKSEFSPEFIDRNEWFVQWKDIALKTKIKLKKNDTPALLKLADSCSSFKFKDWLIISSSCILRTPSI